jgi:hypothetical protein
MGTNDKGDSINDDSACGVIPRALSDLFNIIAEHSDSHDAEVSVSYVELHVNKIRDLLDDDAKELHITEDATGSGPALREAVKKAVDSFEDAMRALAEASERRAHPSRSHVVLTFIVAASPKSCP